MTFKPRLQQIVISFGGINITFLSGNAWKNIWQPWIQILEHSSHPTSYPGFYTHFTFYNIDINYLTLDGENISHATCWTDEFETITKPQPSCRLCPWCRFHRRYKRGFFLVGGISDKSLSDINNNIKVSRSWMLMRMGPLLTLLCKTWLFLSGKVKMTLRETGHSLKKKHHSDKSHSMASIGIGFIIFAPAHGLNNWTQLCWGESVWPEY